MPAATFTANAVIANRHFTADAIIVGNFLRHVRGGPQHSGTQDTTTVVLSAAIGPYPVGTSLQTVLASMLARLAALESANLTFGQFTVNSYIGWYLTAKAIIRDELPFSFTANAVISSTGPLSFTANSVIFRASPTKTFTVEAFIV